MTGVLIDTLLRTLDADPTNDALRAHVLALLLTERRIEEAVDHGATLLERGALSEDLVLKLGDLALTLGRSDLAARLLEEAYDRGLQVGVEALARRLAETTGRASAPPLSHGPAASPTNGPLRAYAGEPVSFEHVGGLESVKAQIRRRIVLPFQKPSVFQRWKRRAGGGVLLYGPPGCGKTLIARATAHECGVPFFSLRAEDVLSRWIGESEQLLHAAFDAARAQRPCVVFIDELDALGFARARQQSNGMRGTVDQLLTELDSVGGENDNLLVLAATNAPWDLDDALLRPGRFDRLVFIPPPDEEARRVILDALLAGRPVEGVDVGSLAKKTEQCSGADLRELIERAVDEVIDESIAAGQERSLGPHHIDAAFSGFRPSTLEWTARARNYVTFANEHGRYDDVMAWIDQGPKRPWWKRATGN